MNSDDFEKRVQRQSLRRIPPEWRQEILQAVRTATVDRPPAHPGLLSTLNSQLSTLLWPHPRIWAGLAATWAVILCFHLAAREDSPPTLAKAPTRLEILMAMQEQKWLMTQLNEPGEAREAVVPPRPSVPRPRSERPWDSTTV